MSTLKKLIIIVIAIACISAGAYFVNALVQINPDPAKIAIKISSLSKGLVLHQPLDRESLQSATTFGDKTPYENVGTKYGSVLKFDGGDDYVSIPHSASLDITEAITISAWIKRADLSTNNNKGIIRKEGTGGYILSLNYAAGDHKISYIASGVGTRKMSTAIQDTDWHHIVCTIDESANQLKFYLDGDIDITHTKVGTLAANGSNLAIGLRSNYFNGSIGDTRIYSRALEPDEVTTLYQGGAVSETGLEAHYKFGDKAGATLLDETANNNDGTLNGFTSTAAGYGDTHDSGWATLDTPNVFALDRMGQSDRAMSFDGESDYINCGNDESLNITDAITIEAWVKVDTFRNYDAILGKADAGINANNPYLLNVRTDKRMQGIVGDGIIYNQIYSDVLTEGQWYHAVFTVDESYLKMYIDGIEEMSANRTVGNFVINNTILKIGHQTSWGYFNGQIADVRIYNRALEPEEITMLYEQYRPKLSVGSLQKGLVLDMPLKSKYTKGGAVGSEILTDRTPQSNDGTNHGATVEADYTTFNGTSDYIDCGNDASLDITDEITISAWVKPNATNVHQMLYSRGLGGQCGIWLGLYNNGTIWLGYGDGTIRQDVISSGSYDTNWQHLVMVFQNKDVELYRNLIKDIKNWPSLPNDLSYSDNRTKIGSNYVSTAYFFDGSIADVRIYDRALEPEEIMMLYDKGR